MSDYGEEIIDLLGEDCGLRKKDNPIRAIINDGIGEWLDHFVAENDFDNFFLDSATGGYLDLWGKDYGVPRKIDEDDESYRSRIIYETLGYLTIPYLRNVYGLTLYVFVDDYDPVENTLTSDNPYIKDNGFLIYTTDDIIQILERKFIVDSNVHLRYTYGDIFYDTGVNPQINELWNWNSNYTVVTPSSTGVSVINEDTVTSRVFWLNKQGTSTGTIYDWTDDVIISCDIVSCSDVYLQLFDGKKNCIVDLDEFTGTVKAVKSFGKVDFYLDDDLVSSFDWSLGAYRIAFWLAPSGEVVWKDFRVMYND